MVKKIIDDEQVRLAEKQIKEFQSLIEYDTKDFTIELLLSKYNKGDFFIPEYQRDFVWKPKNKSLFIESVLLGLPIPFMFFAGRDDGRLEIIDGAQRMQTLNAFFRNELQLSNLQKLTELNGFKFENLPTVQQRKLNNRTFRIVVLDENTTVDIRQDLFNRINTSGVKATDSEIRRGSYPGKLTSFIEECCQNESFIKLCPVSKSKSSRHERFELVLRFFAYLNNYQSFIHNVNTFLDEFLSANLNNFDESNYNKEFIAMLSFVENHFEYGFAKVKNATTTPRVRFEAISIGTALALRINPTLKVNNVNWITSDEFKELTTSDASNNQGKLVSRIEFVRNKLLEEQI